MLKQAFFVTVLSAAASAGYSAERAVAPSRQSAILAEITQAALTICPPVATTSQTSQAQASARINAGLAGLSRKVGRVDLGAQARLQRASSSGVLQKDLAVALRDTTTCRTTIVQILADKLLGPPTRP